ncbi:Membrane-bound alkaline phosphatase [Eumeta japonica]|uniref:Alkaline phosphatase n=1 Tax=Eumeta variegata TaxID=151549 RepID=A0A4C1ZGW8_EUMVA|nr:Membrane-bound alkaline phosphatase [Eumeta japonica]
MLRANAASVIEHYALSNRRLRIKISVIDSCRVDKEEREYHPRWTHDDVSAQSTARVDPREASAEFWRREAQDALSERLARAPNTRVAKNVVMFLGDGLSVPTLAAARTYQGQLEGRTGEEEFLSFERFPTVGLSKTYCVNYQVPDSACTATAYLCGVKNNYGTIGVTAQVPRRDCAASTDNSTHLSSIAEWALNAGKDAGIVTTTRITHASPAGAFARVANRNWENDAEVLVDNADPLVCRDIAHQLVHEYPGNRFKVILGGGRRNFRNETVRDEENSRGRRHDGRDLIEEWQEERRRRNENHAYVWNRQGLLSVPLDETDYLLGLFESNHMQYHLQADSESEPTLEELTEAAIRILSKNPEGFFLFVEGGRIDHAHHDNFARMALDETVEFSKAVQRAAELLSEEDSLLVVTADHAHVMSINGYSRRGRDILGLSDDRDEHGVPFMTLSYTNGPGFRSHTAAGSRPDLSGEDLTHEEWRSHVDVPLDSETHGGDDVAVFARGPHHHLFTGLYEQSQLPHLMAYASCVGPGLTVCSTDGASTTAPALIALLLVMLPFMRL